MTKTLTILHTLQKKIDYFNQQIKLQREGMELAKKNHKARLNSHRAKVKAAAYEACAKFRGHPYLVVLLVALLLFLLWNNATTAVNVMISFLCIGVGAVCLKSVWFWVSWYKDISKPDFNNGLITIKELEEEIRRHRQGLGGERLVARYLDNKLPKSYKILNDLTLYFEGKWVQMDHVVVGPTGIFVIETKNITGNYYSDNMGWLRYPAHTIKGIPVRNYRRVVISCPQEQSLRQKKSLENYLLGLAVKVNNAIVIPNKECKWNGGPKDKKAPVVSLSGLRGFILKQEQNLDVQQIEAISTKLLGLGIKMKEY